MDTQRIDIRLEDFICRIPAMFPYLEWNEDGTVYTHVATDSPNGSYGKIVDNMHMPPGVSLTNYVNIQENEVKDGYQWTNGNTILLSQDENDVFSVSGAEYLRKVIWYEYVINNRGFVDGVILDELPSFVGDNSPEKVKIPKRGVDGVLIECSEPVYDYYVKVGHYMFFERRDIISQCTTYSYKTIISEYYKYKDIVGNNNSFIKFVNTGIGLMDVDRELLNLTNENVYSEVPDQIYLSQSRTLLLKYRKYQKASTYYNKHYVANNKTDAVLAEKSKKYIRMGGDNMTNWLAQIVQTSYDIANEYKCYADNKDFPVRANANVMLTTHSYPTGLESVIENEFIPGKRFYDGDLLTYNGRTYICMLDRYLEDSPNNYNYIIKTKNVNGNIVKGLFELVNDEYNFISEDNITYILNTESIPSTCITSFVVYKNLYYKWVANSYTQIEVTEYSTGVFDEESKRYVFDKQHFVLLSEIEGYNNWYDDSNVDGEDYRFFENTNYIPSKHTYDYIMSNNSIFGWDEDLNMYVPVEGNAYVLTNPTNSKLKVLRTFKEYVNPFGVGEEPDESEDWLYYYKINTVSGLVVETDAFGNILKDTDDFDTITRVCYDLHAYGNIITNITYNSFSNTITFEYVIGAHLTAVFEDEDEDIDGNPIFYYSNFAYDDNSEDGIKFIETYNCIGTEISGLGVDFNDYINGDVATMIRHSYKKFPFQTVPAETPDGIKNVMGVGKSAIPVNNDLTHLKTVREEWMHGLYHQPKIKNDILIDRGNGASFERHMRLGEIHTMEDFENYQNGGYFKISEN